MLTREEASLVAQVLKGTRVPGYLNGPEGDKLSRRLAAILAKDGRARLRELENDPRILALQSGLGELFARLAGDKEADVGVVLSKVFGEITGVLQHAAAALAPPPKAIVQPHLLTMQIFRRRKVGVDIGVGVDVGVPVDDVHERTESYGPGVIKIGTLSTSHLKLDDPKVNRMHAVMEFDQDGRVIIIDLGSTVGTLVNGQRINKAELKDGYVVRIGDTTLGVSLV